MTKFPPINDKCPHLLHGADYNPDQWLHRPDILAEDLRLMKAANCNVMSVGIFAWAALEPEEGKFTFAWLDQVMDQLAKHQIYAFLATPSGARPAWLSRKYPEVLRVEADRKRILHGNRHNHCYTSPVYREKVRVINTKLAERYQEHPVLLGWHISNEYGGECHCELCQAAFRKWLQKKYQTLEALNHAWWTAFWSHTYTDWSEIESPAPHGEQFVHGLNLDWKRFVTHQTLDFYQHEIAPLKAITPAIPVTTNFMGTYPGLDYWKFANDLDVVAWDSYPRWHEAKTDWQTAAEVAFVHDLNRSLKQGKPFMLMESTPSMTNWTPVSKLKRPGMHLLSSLQAVAHGADAVQYFQWRKSRGATEKFHGAVVDHVGHEKTRVFREVAEVGEVLKRLDPVVGTSVKPEVALLFDWENRWALEDAQGLKRNKKYEETCYRHYRSFWSCGIPVDVINQDCAFSRYRLLIAPMLYMVRPGVGERLTEFVAGGGTLVVTYWSGIVDQHDLCFLGGFPGPLRKVLGIWSEEIDGLYDDDENYVTMLDRNALGLEGEYRVKDVCDLIHLETAEALGVYREDFYAGRPALTVNRHGQGEAYYLASRNEDRFLNGFYRRLIDKMQLRQALPTELPVGVTAQLRTDGCQDYVFLLNFTTENKVVDLNGGEVKDLVADQVIRGHVELPPYGVRILERSAL
ncbi:MAG TPA: beta-galactosidase [Firmicutes bacterium]|nr:beta-galactosidase [Bacillota bacterium]